MAGFVSFHSLKNFFKDFLIANPSRVRIGSGAPMERGETFG